MRLQAATSRVAAAEAKLANAATKITELQATLAAAVAVQEEAQAKLLEGRAELQAVSEMAALSVCPTSVAAAGSLAGTAMTLVAGILAQLNVNEDSQRLCMNEFQRKLNAAAGVPPPTPQAQPTQ